MRSAERTPRLQARPGGAGRRLLGAMLAATPVVFGALRALQTGTDFRYVIVAGVVLGTSVLAYRVTRPRGPMVRAGLSLIAATLLGALAAVAVGATSAAAIVIVTLGFALCTTAAMALFARPATA